MANANVLNVTDANFDAEVLQSDKPLIDTADMINATTSVIKEGR